MAPRPNSSQRVCVSTSASFGGGAAIDGAGAYANKSAEIHDDPMTLALFMVAPLSHFHRTLALHVAAFLDDSVHGGWQFAARLKTADLPSVGTVPAPGTCTGWQPTKLSSSDSCQENDGIRGGRCTTARCSIDVWPKAAPRGQRRIQSDSHLVCGNLVSSFCLRCALAKGVLQEQYTAHRDHLGRDVSNTDSEVVPLVHSGRNHAGENLNKRLTPVILSARLPC